MEIENWLGSDNELGVTIWKNKYQVDDETFDEWLNRVSGGDIALRDLMETKRFLFGGRVLANRGIRSDYKVTLANCYCLPLEDHLEGIFDTAKWMARTYSYGGGVGINIGRLCPADAKVYNAAKSSSGATSFGDLYDLATGLIGQAGRRGALMLAMPCDHPEIEKFITIKSDLNKLTHANISVMVYNDFMEAVSRNLNYDLSFTRTTGEKIKKDVDARSLFMKLVKNNWDYAEPGILYWDRITNWSLLSEHPDFEYECVNPCGELPLPAFGACCLGSMNLVEYVDLNDDQEWIFNYNRFVKDIPIVVKAMNDVLDDGLSMHPLQQQRETVAKWRQIGIGVMGFADMLIHLGVKYGSQDSVNIASTISMILINESAKASAMLAKKHGPFPAYNREAMLKSEFFNKVFTDETKELVKKYGIRNSSLLSIAPTGTLSTMLGISGGIEPIFATSYNRRTESLHGESKIYKVFTPLIRTIMDDYDIVDEKNLPDYVVTSAQISPEDRVRMQSVWQYNIDNSISSTVNLPVHATEEQVKQIYILAWQMGLKGITVFRDGCKRLGILTTEESTTNVDKLPISEETIKKMFDPKSDLHTVSNSSIDGSNTVTWTRVKPNNNIKDECTAKISGEFKQPDYVPPLKQSNYTIGVDIASDAKIKITECLGEFFVDNIISEVPELKNFKAGKYTRGQWKPLAEDTMHKKIKIKTGCGKLTLFAGWSEQEQRIQELWVKQTGKGGCERSADAIAILMSAVFRLGGDIHNIEKAFRDMKVCNSYGKAREKGRQISPGGSCADSMLKALKAFAIYMHSKSAKVESHAPEHQLYEDDEGDLVFESELESAQRLVPVFMRYDNTEEIVAAKGAECPECGSELCPDSGCFTCRNCGWSRCG